MHLGVVYIMSKMKRIFPAPCPDGDTTPFQDGEDAWFWFARCQMMRRDGARIVSGLTMTPRPCVPDDVYRTVMGLFRRNHLDNVHLQVLGSYGEKMCPPDEYVGDEKDHVPVWRDALEKLGKALQKKGIVE